MEKYIYFLIFSILKYISLYILNINILDILIKKYINISRNYFQLKGKFKEKSIN